MVKFYVLQIKLGKIALEDVPTRWREKVDEALMEDGGANDDITN